MQTSEKFRVTPGVLVRLLADAVLIQLAVVAALSIRFYAVLVDGTQSTQEVFQRFVGYYVNSTWALTAICLTVFLLNGFYTYGRYYRGRYKLIVITQAVSLSFLIYTFLFWIVDYFPTQLLKLPRASLILAWVFTLALVVGARAWSAVWTHFVHPERQAAARRHGQKRVLVVGGAGYIGSALLPMLLKRGYQVRLLDMLMFGEEPIKDVIDHPNLEVMRGDFRHVENMVEAVRDIDAVIHLGAIVGDPACSLDEDLTIDVNLSATRMIAQVAKSHGVERFVFASTCSVYGACDEMLDENSEVKPVSLYGHTKLASERVLLKMADANFSPSIVRFATIYGLSGRTRFDLVVNLLTAKAKFDGEITVFGGDQWRPFVHVQDAAKAVATILDAPKPIVANQIFNVGSNAQNYTINQIGELVADAVVGAELKLSGLDGDTRNYRVDFSKISNLLRFTPDWTVEEGIQQVLEAIASGDIVDYQDAHYSNVKFLNVQGTGVLARKDWAKEMIQSLTSQ